MAGFKLFDHQNLWLIAEILHSKLRSALRSAFAARISRFELKILWKEIVRFGHQLWISKWSRAGMWTRCVRWYNTQVVIRLYNWFHFEFFFELKLLGQVEWNFVWKFGISNFKMLSIFEFAVNARLELGFIWGFIGGPESIEQSDQSNSWVSPL